MKKSLVALGIAACTALLAGCDAGPSGPHPAHETTVPIYTSIDRPITYDRVAGTATLGVDASNNHVITVRTVQRPTESVSMSSLGMSLFDARFQRGAQDDRHVFASIFLDLPDTVSAPGTWDLAAAKLTGTSASSVILSANVNVTLANGQTKYKDFYVVSGKAGISKVTKMGGDTVAIQGWVSGQLKSVFPIDFEPTSGQLFPPGFDVNNPSFMGETLILHSFTFDCIYVNGIAIIE